MTERFRCVEITAHELGDRAKRISSGSDQTEASEALAIPSEITDLALSPDTVVVQAITEYPEGVYVLGFIYATGVYTPQNMLGLINMLKNEDKANVSRETKILLARAKNGLPSNIRNPFVGRAPIHTNGHELSAYE